MTWCYEGVGHPFLSSFVVFPTFFLMSLSYCFEEDAIFLIERGPCFEKSCFFIVTLFSSTRAGQLLQIWFGATGCS